MDTAAVFDVGAVLDHYYDLHDHTGTSANWSEQAFRDNPPRLYRYQRLQALLRAFQLPLDPVALEGSKFLAGRDPAACWFLYDELTTLYQQGKLHAAPRPPDDGRSYGLLYQHFFRLLHEQYRLQSINSGWLEASSAEAQYAIQVAARFANSYDHAQLVTVRQLVCRLLDPAGRQFTRRELVARFDFPDVDLEEIDFEWM